MGVVFSSRLNRDDIWLAIVVSKYLEEYIDKNYHTARHSTLSEKITDLRYMRKIDHDTFCKLEKLVNWRNRLVHDPNINRFDDMGTSYEKFNSTFEVVRGRLNSQSGLDPHNVAVIACILVLWVALLIASFK